MRKKKEPKKKKVCIHPAWKFKPIPNGMRRKCTRCGEVVIEMASGIFGKPFIQKPKKAAV
jgi:hypothetical protein